MKKTRLFVLLTMLVTFFAANVWAQEGESGDDSVELIEETAQYTNDGRFRSATFGERPDTITDVSGALRDSMYGAEVEPNPAGSGNQATEIKIYFKFDGALAGRAGYQLYAWVVAEDILGKSHDFSVNWNDKMSQLIAADSDVDRKLFPITVLDGEETYEFEDSVDGKTAFVTWCANNLVSAMTADEQLKQWADEHDMSILTHYKTGFRLVREGDIFIKRGDDEPGEEENKTDYSLSPRRLYFSPSGATYSTIRTSDYITRRGGARMTNPNYNFGTLTKRNDEGELETYIVSGLRRPSLYTGELTFTLLVVTRLLQFKTLYHEITGREAIQALIALRVIKISGGQYVPDTCFHASAKSGSGSNWSSYGGWDMFSEADLARLNEIYPVEE